jgi:integrase
MKYTFDDPRTPSLSDMRLRVASDTSLPITKRRELLCRLGQVARWIEDGRGNMGGIKASGVPFTAAHVEALARRLAPATCSRAYAHAHKTASVTEKTVDNALSACRFLLRYYALSDRQPWAPLTPEWERLNRLIDDAYNRMNIKRLLCFFSAQELRPEDVSADAVAPFIGTVEADVRVADADLAARRALRVWCQMADRFPEEWPQLHLHMPSKRVIWGRKWSEMTALENAVDVFFAPPLPGQLFKSKRKKKLKPSTIRTQKEALRCFASALLNDGVPAGELGDLRALCNPRPFERGISLLEARAGAVTHWVEKIARVVLKIAKYGDVLTGDEIEEVKALYKEVSSAYAEWKKDRPDRDQALLDKLDDERLMNAFIALPTKTVRQVLASGKMTHRAAYAIQKALILELWLCSALRNVNLLGLRRDNFRRLTIDGVEWVVLSVSAHETKNGEATEHFLLPDVAQLLDLYLEKYLPIIAQSASQSLFLFPGKNGVAKVQQTLRVQMTNFVCRHLKLDGFHPHAVRKIVPKIALDEDPSAIEVVRRVGGWKGEKTLRRVYLQKRNRVAQARYVELLEARRLKAFGSGMNARKPANAT